MAVDQLPGRVREFTDYLNGLLTRLDPRAGWCAVFWQRDPEGMRACLDGHELPPWDVLEALLQDLAHEYGGAVAARERERVRVLHGAALDDLDALPGARDAIGDRLDVMLREQRYAAERLAGLGRSLAAVSDPEEDRALRLDLAWAQDDYERATARCAELRGRIERLRARPPVVSGGSPGEEAPAAPVVPKQRKRRRGSARFAGVVEEEAAGAAPVAAVPEAAGSGGGSGGPRGARFAGVDEGPVEVRSGPGAVVDAGVRREIVGTVETLVRLRGEGRSGEAHALLVEVAYWPAVRYPLLAVELERAGLGADWATLLWEAASLPADRLVAAADALVAAGRGEDGERILRQGVVRSAEEIGVAVLGLVGDGRRREAGALLDAYVRMRTPEEAARSVVAEPQVLVPLLLEAARSVSAERHWDVLHALRVAGLTA
ncbi:hypothetical protein [Streptomyces broussonetiae]|uniref:UL36 very large tegument protein n=1 Tax=Streptomyces broussonetiae TaxID=2686304 RepID=A0ABV5E4C0_9ACTN